MEMTRTQWFTLIFFVAVVAVDWMYIFFLLKQEEIINFLLVLSPAVFSLAVVLSLISGIKIYFRKKSGFLGACLIVFASIVAILFSYDYIHAEFSGIVFLLIILGLNVISFVCLLLFYIASKKKVPHKVMIKMQ